VPDPTKVAFLDRDGTVCEEMGYVVEPSLLRPYPYAAESIRLLNEAGWTVFLTTNQSGIARGYTTEALVLEVNHRLTARLEEQGAKVSRVYYCPHHPLAVCGCRKPMTGMVEQALSDFRLEPTRMAVIGDKDCDVQMGQAIGATTVMLLTGYGETDRHRVTPDHLASDLLAGVAWLIHEASS